MVCVKRSARQLVSRCYNVSLWPAATALQPSRRCSIAAGERAESVEPLAARLATRGVIRFDGRDAIHFLQGLLTNDVTPFLSETPPDPAPFPTPNQPAACFPPIYSALLSPQGRLLFDLFLYRPPNKPRPLQGHPTSRLDSTAAGPLEGDEDAPELLADVDASMVDELLVHLNRYRLRANVSFQDASHSFSVWSLFGAPFLRLPSHPSHPSDPDAAAAGHIGWEASDDVTAQRSAEATGGGWSWVSDPRLPALPGMGMRGVFPAGELPPLVTSSSEVSESEYRKFRYKLGVAEGSSEMVKGECLPLEFNLAALHAISFSKGCYVGQELTARTHHRGVVRKRVMPLTFGHQHRDGDGEGPSWVGSEVIDASTGKPAGKVVAAQGGRGLGLLRLSSALKEGAQLQVKGGGETEAVAVCATRPTWWPPEWGHEEE